MPVAVSGENLYECRRACEQVAVGMGFAEPDVDGICAAVFEACVNAITHGRGKRGDSATLRLHASSGKLEAVIADSGIGLQRSLSPEMPGPESLCGRGVPIMFTFMDEVAFESGEGCRVTLVKYLPGSYS